MFCLHTPSFGHPDEQDITYPVETCWTFSGVKNVEWDEVEMRYISYRQFHLGEKKAFLHWRKFFKAGPIKSDGQGYGLTEFSKGFFFLVPKKHLKIFIQVNWEVEIIWNKPKLSDLFKVFIVEDGLFFT